LRLQWAGVGILIAALVALQLVPARVPGVAVLEGTALDARFHLRGPVAPGDETVLVMIDDTTLTRHGRWPLPRELVARGIERIAEADPRVVIFDLLFAGAGDELSESEAATLRRVRDAVAADRPGLAEALDRMLAQRRGDIRLAATIAAAGNVLVPFAFVFDPAEANVPSMPASLAGAAYPVTIDHEGRPPPRTARPAGVLAPVDVLAEAAATRAHVTVRVEPDGRLRHDLPALEMGGAWYPSLPVEAVRAWLGLPRPAVAPVLGDGLRLGERFVPTDTLMRLPVNHYGPAGTFPTVSFADLVAGEFDPALLRDRLVVIGGAAKGVGDNFATPFDQTLPGAEHHATVIDNLLHGRSLVRDRTTKAIEIAAIVLLGLGAALASRSRALALGGLGAGLLLAAWAGVNYLAFDLWHLWIGFVAPTAALALVFAWCATLGTLRERRRRALAERRRRNLARYFSPAVVDTIVDRDEPYGFDRQGPAAVMFVDLAGFTALGERMAPDAAMTLLRTFHGRVVRAVFGRGGSVDKFLGDGAMACFGMPVPDPAAAANALAAARDLAADMESWNEGRREAGQPPLGFGIGIHYGPVLAGDLGGADRFEFTVAGDTVNVASRLEGLTRTLGARIVVSQAGLDAARQVDPELAAAFTELPPHPIRGRDEAIAIAVWPAPDGGGSG